MAGLKVLAKTSQKISIGADTFRLKVAIQHPLFGAWFRGYFQMYTAPSHKYSVADIFDGF